MAGMGLIRPHLFFLDGSLKMAFKGEIFCPITRSAHVGQIVGRKLVTMRDETQPVLNLADGSIEYCGSRHEKTSILVSSQLLQSKSCTMVSQRVGVSSQYRSAQIAVRPSLVIPAKE